MRSLILFIAIALNVFAASLLSMSTNENKDSVEINLALDSSFEGFIEQNITSSATTLKISGISIDSNKDISFSKNSLVSRLTVTKDAPTVVKLEFKTKQPIGFEALKNNDGYKLQLKLTPSALVSMHKDSNGSATQAGTKATVKQDDGFINEDNWRYVVVITFLLFLVLIAMYIKKRVLAKQNGSSAKLLTSKATGKEESQDEVQVVTQSFLDPNNKMMLVEYNGIKYLLLVGNTNLVVDRYYSDDLDVENDNFKTIMLENEKKLNEFLKPQGQISNFDEYRSKAEGNL